jgi:4-hydroxy-tetrahydrodipicolinate reductase
VIRIAIVGVTGRMGRALVRAVIESPSLAVAGAVASAGSSALGHDAGDLVGLPPVGVPVTHDLGAAIAHADVTVDFSNAAATAFNLTTCREARKPLLIGTTGFSPELEKAFDVAAQDIPLLVAANTSVGVTLLIELVRQAAQALPDEFDIEIVEAHHRMKRDAPSGTALALGRAAAEGRQRSFEDIAVLQREDAPRRKGDIGFAAIRGGDIVGDHSVLFAGAGERLVLAHQATDRAIFARGALKAAAWLASRAPGRYFMRDIFSFK